MALQERLYRLEAQKLLDQIIEKNEEEKSISIILEYSVGKVHETIQRMVCHHIRIPSPPGVPERADTPVQIHIYEPVILIVGTRGRSLGGLQGLLPGSVSKYCLQHSPVPVIVVRPSSKRDKKKAKRRADPGRRVYQDMLQQSNLMLDESHSLAGITEGLSNASISTLGGDRSSGEGTPPKTMGPIVTTDTPSPGILTPHSGSPVANSKDINSELAATGAASSAASAGSDKAGGS